MKTDCELTVGMAQVTAVRAAATGCTAKPLTHASMAASTTRRRVVGIVKMRHGAS